MSKLHASGHRLHALLERVRVLLEPVTKRWLGSPMDDQQARAAGQQPFEADHLFVPADSRGKVGVVEYGISAADRGAWRKKRANVVPDQFLRLLPVALDISLYFFQHTAECLQLGRCQSIQRHTLIADRAGRDLIEQGLTFHA